MQLIQGFLLDPHPGEYDTWPETSALRFEGRPTGTQLPGYVVEAQYRCRHGFLLITSYDCPYEEANSFVLLDQRFQTLASAALGAMYGSYLLHDHWPLDDDTLQLHYQMRRFYQLQVRPPRALLRRGFDLRLARDEQAWGSDPRAKASVAALERSLQAQRVDAIVDAVPVVDPGEHLEPPENWGRR